MMAQKAANTLKAYAHRWSIFSDWCRRAGRVALPATPDTVKLYIAWAVEVNGNRLETVKLTMSAILHQHTERNLASPLTSEVRKFIALCVRSLQEEPRGRAAVTPQQVDRISKALGDTPLAVRDRAIILLGFASGWRSDELASLRLTSVSITGKGVLLRLGRSKTDQMGHGRMVGVHYGQNPNTCPVRALKAWLDVRGAIKGPLFYQFFSSGHMRAKGLSARGMRVVVKRSLELIGVDPGAYGSHSLRVGMITAATENGASIAAIQSRTGHRSVSTILRYVRPAEAFTLNPLAGVL
jgi:site-specific recombinase XerD